MRTLLLSPLLLALACQEPPTRVGEQRVEARVHEPAPSDSTCTAAPLEAELVGFCDFDLGVPPIRLPKVEWTAASYHPLATRVITVDERGLSDPEGAGTVSIQAWLDDPPRRLPEPGEMVFAIAADIPATTVAELERGLAAAGRKQVRYLVHVADPRPIPTPRDPQLFASLGEALPAGANDRVVFAANAVKGFAQICSPIAGVFPQLVKVGPGDRCAKLGELAAKAIVECGCSQVDRIMTLLYALTIGFEVPSGRTAAVVVEVSPTLETAEGQTWGQLAAARLHR
jgi:hypothetical protein